MRGCTDRYNVGVPSGIRGSAPPGITGGVPLGIRGGAPPGITGGVPLGILYILLFFTGASSCTEITHFRSKKRLMKQHPCLTIYYCVDFCTLCSKPHAFGGNTCPRSTLLCRLR